MNEVDLEKRFPFVPWREAITVHGPDGVPRCGCRFCIALFGLEASAIVRLPRNHSEFIDHFNACHLPILNEQS